MTSLRDAGQHHHLIQSKLFQLLKKFSFLTSYNYIIDIEILQQVLSHKSINIRFLYHKQLHTDKVHPAKST